MRKAIRARKTANGFACKSEYPHTRKMANLQNRMRENPLARKPESPKKG